jgi:prolyl oligopeptidase
MTIRWQRQWGPIVFALILLGTGSPGARQSSPAGSVVSDPPPTRRDDVKETLHGVELIDPYRWLESQDAPETRAFIDAQNAYAHRLLDPLPYLSAIRERLTTLSRRDSQWAPAERGGRYFILRRRASDDLPILFVRDGLTGEDTVLLDPHPLSADHTTSVTVEDISLDGRVLVYGLRTSGEDETELRVRDVGTRKDLPDRLPRALYRGVSLRPDGSGFFYALQDRAAGIRIRHHAIGGPVAQDTTIFGEGFGASDWIGAAVSENGKHLLLSVSHGWASGEIYAQRLDAASTVQPIVRGLDAHIFGAFAGDRLIAQTDWNAPTGRIVEIDPDHPGPAAWRDIVPTGPDVIEAFAPVGGRIVVQRLHNVTSQLDVDCVAGPGDRTRAFGSMGT